MKNPTNFIAVLLCCGLAACATPEQRFNKALYTASITPFYGRPHLYQLQLRDGDISPACYDWWMKAWNKEKPAKDKERKAESLAIDKEEAKKLSDWNSLTPYQREQIRARDNQAAMLAAAAMYQGRANYDQQQAQQQAVQGALQNLSNGLNQQAQANQNPYYQPPQRVNVYINGVRDYNAKGSLIQPIY